MRVDAPRDGVTATQDLDCVLALLRHGADASLRDVACSNAGGFALKRGAGPTTDLGRVLLAARDRGPANAIDAYEALDAYRRTKKYLQTLKVTKALLEVDVDTCVEIKLSRRVSATAES